MKCNGSRVNLVTREGHNSKLKFDPGILVREKRRKLTQSYDKRPYTHRKIQKATRQYKNATKTSFTHRLRIDLGRYVGVTTATQLVWLNWLTISQPSHSPQQLCN